MSETYVEGTSQVPPAPARTIGAARSAGSIALFLLTAVLGLVADLGLKQWSFAHLADGPPTLGPVFDEKRQETVTKWSVFQKILCVIE